METICFDGSKFLPLRIDHILGSLCPPGKQTVPLKTWQKKMEVYPYTLSWIMDICSIKYHKKYTGI